MWNVVDRGEIELGNEYIYTLVCGVVSHEEEKLMAFLVRIPRLVIAKAATLHWNSLISPKMVHFRARVSPINFRQDGVTKLGEWIFL